MFFFLIPNPQSLIPNSFSSPSTFHPLPLSRAKPSCAGMKLEVGNELEIGVFLVGREGLAEVFAYIFKDWSCSVNSLPEHCFGN
jgi:hypothetical protein